jgi:hypothetical protein
VICTLPVGAGTCVDEAVAPFLKSVMEMIPGELAVVMKTAEQVTT